MTDTSAHPTGDTRVPPAHRPWLAPVWLALIALAGCLYLQAQNPDEPHAVLPECPTKMLTGLDCPMCGSLRCVHALTSGQWSAAAHDNLFLLVLGPLLLVGWVRWLVAGLTGDAYQPRVSARTGWGLLLLATAWMVIRNLPAWPLHPVR